MNADPRCISRCRILADSADHVVARSWHGSPGRQAIVGPGSRDVLVHVDRLAPPETPEATGEAIGRLIAGFVGARFEVRVLTRGQPSARWPVPARRPGWDRA